MKAIAYLRTSTHRQLLGIETQQKEVIQWASSNGIQILSFYSDLGISGSLPLEKRQGLQQALSHIEKEKVDVLIVYHRDRLARNMKIAKEIDEKVLQLNAKIVTVIKSNNYTDRFSEIEGILIKKRTRAALAVKRARNERSGMIPYGYALGPDGIHLVENVAEQATLAKVRNYRRSGMVLRAIVAVCERDGMVSRAGKPFGLTQIANMCKNVLLDAPPA